MIKCIIVEDQPPAQKILQKYVSNTDGLLLLDTFGDAFEAKRFLEDNLVDLIFLDIKLPKITGIELLKSVKNHPFTILTTAFSDYALESYEYNVVDYLLKPFSYERFSQAVDKVTSLIEPKSLLETSSKNTQDAFLYLKSGHDLIKVHYEEILLIKSDADYTEVITDSKKHLSSYSLKDWLVKLDDTFCQVHKSYIINLKYLNKISRNKIFLTEAHIIPIGRAYKKNFMEKYVTE